MEAVTVAAGHAGPAAHAPAPPHDGSRGRPARRGERLDPPRDRAARGDRRDGRPAFPARAADLLAVATVADEGSHFRRGLPQGARAISKPGALEGVRCEAAWVDVPGRPYSAAIMTAYLRHEADGEAAIAELVGRHLRHLRPTRPLQRVRPHHQRSCHGEVSRRRASGGGRPSASAMGTGSAPSHPGGSGAPTRAHELAASVGERGGDPGLQQGGRQRGTGRGPGMSRLKT